MGGEAEHKKTGRKQLYPVIVLVVVVVVVVAAAFLFMYGKVYDTIISMNVSSMEELASHDMNSVMNTLNERWNDLQATAEAVAGYLDGIDIGNVDIREALAARDYFCRYHPGLNRRAEDPVNSRLNYGYAVTRSYIARSLVAAGFHPTFGIHHDSQLNAFNLADDLIEPYRAMVDLVAHENIASNLQLTRKERSELAHVLHNACMLNGNRMNVMSAVDAMVESLKRIILDSSHEDLCLPVILPVESMEGITE